MINRSNYEKIIGEFGLENLDTVLKTQHENYLSIQEFYDDDDEIKQTIDLYFSKLEKFINKFNHGRSKSPAKKEPDSPTRKQRSQPKLRKSSETKSVTRSNREEPQAEKKEANVKIKSVEHLSEEVKFIKRYVALHNKVKSPNAILAFIKSLQRAMVQKIIAKASPFAAEIQMIQDKLVRAYNKMTGPVPFSINRKDLDRLVAIAGGEQVYTSIAVIRRFIGLQEKTDENKVAAFLKYMESLVKKKKLTKEDPYADKVASIYKAIKQRKGDKVPITKAELNGLEGIIKACSCHSDMGRVYDTGGRKLRPCKQGTYSDAKTNGACSHNKGLSGVLTAEEMGNRKFESLDFDYPWNVLMGNPAKNFTIMFHGEPGSGKTTLLLKFAEYLANDFGNVLYISSEEHGASTLTDKINELLQPKPKNLDFAPDLETPDLSGYQFIILDSINDLGLKLDDFKMLRKDNPHAAFILVLQHTKDGNYRGGKDWEHHIEIGVSVESGVATVYRTRYGVKGSLNFFAHFNTKPIQSIPETYQTNF